jgi:hypothetical protein
MTTSLVRIGKTSFLALLLCAVSLPGQTTQNQSPGTVAKKRLQERIEQEARTKSLTRLAYKSESHPQVCLAVDQNGRYMLWRSTTAQAVGGTLPPDQRKELEKLFGDLRPLAGSGAMLVHREARVLILDMPGARTVERRSWVSDADGEKPFPAPVNKIVGWLQEFKPEHSKEVEADRQEICPSGDLKPLQPSLTGF